MSDAPNAVNEEKAINQTNEQESKTEKEQGEAAKEFDQKSNTSHETMHLRVAAPFREYYDGQAFSISAVNGTGPFDILPQHHNFISLLNACDLIIRGESESEEKAIKISISGGVMHVKSDEVIVFLDV